MGSGRTFLTTCWSCESLVEAEYLSDEVHIGVGNTQARCLECGQFVPTKDA